MPNSNPTGLAPFINADNRRMKMAKQKIQVKAPATGWKVDNIEAPGNGKITMSRYAEINVPDSSGRYLVGLRKPAGKRGPVTVTDVFDEKKREIWDASDFDVEVK
jgi:hypothetical protein